jgi:hypothetical protein
MYAKNMQNLLGLMIKDGQFSLNFDDDIVRGTCIIRDGEVIHEGTRTALGMAPTEAPTEPEAATAPTEAATAEAAETETAPVEPEPTEAERELAAALDASGGGVEEAGVRPDDADDAAAEDAAVPPGEDIRRNANSTPEER